MIFILNRKVLLTYRTTACIRKLRPLLAELAAGLWFGNSGSGASSLSCASCVITDPNLLCLCHADRQCSDLAFSLCLEDEAWLSAQRFPNDDSLHNGIQRSERATKVSTKCIKILYKSGKERAEITWKRFYLYPCFAHLLKLFAGRCWRWSYMRSTF